MIISFSVENYRSFNTEATINLVASNRFAGHHETHAVPIPGSDQRVLKAGILYGANGAGKSNLFRALVYFQRMAIRARRPDAGTGRDPFLLGPTTSPDSSFDMTFIFDDRTWRYGFIVDDAHVKEEWLLQIEGTREKTIFERTTDMDGGVCVKSSYLKTKGGKLAAMALVGGPRNQTFLATIRTTLDPSEYDSELGAAIHGIASGLSLIGPEASFPLLGGYMLSNKEFLDFSEQFLAAASTGVKGLHVAKDEITEDQLKNMVEEETYQALVEGRRTTALVGTGNEIWVERKNGVHYFMVSIEAKHKMASGKTVFLDLDEESDGTRRLLYLMPVLYWLRNANGCFFIDEIDRSMHPSLVWKFIEYFLKSCHGQHRQIIATTHECNLLDLDLIRRDEIWFVEKNQAGASSLYSLADFRVRKDLSIRKHYVQGRFGAIPFLGDIDRLVDTAGDQP